MFCCFFHGRLPKLFLIVALLALACPAAAWAQPALPSLLKAETERVAVVAKVKPTVVAIFARGGQGGGSGVLISDDGYALTNYHVTKGAGNVMQCGLADGVLYDAVLVGQDKVGDVALIKLLPKPADHRFPFAVMGDSDLVREGDWSLAMGNPFLLATDFTPTVTFGLVSGVHRYQYPAGLLLEYTDCIQIDTSINPGNSGGPLFNMKGELIGINGRGSFDKRGRINSGVGYAISINQIKNFMGHLRAGLDTDHASLGARVTTQTEGSGLGRSIVTEILEEADVARRGLQFEDELLSFAGRPMSSVNHFKNVLGLYPRGWRVPLEYRRDQKRKEILVRLMGMQKKLLDDNGDKSKEDDDDLPRPKPQPKEKPQPKQKQPLPMKQPPGPPSPASKYFQARPGFANFFFNQLERDRLLASFRKHGDFAGLVGTWTLEGNVRFKKTRTDSKFRIDLAEEKDGASTKPVVRMKVDAYPYVLEPLKPGQDPATLKTPTESGGFLAAMFLFHKLLTLGEKGFGAEFFHGGFEPLYPPPADGKLPPQLGLLRVDCAVLNTRLGPYLAKWFFDLRDQKLLGFEVRLNDNEDPCEVYLSDYKPVDGRLLPHRLQVIYGDGHYGTFVFTGFQLVAK